MYILEYIAIIQKFENRGYLRLTFRECIVADYMDTRISNFAIKYLFDNEKFHITD